MLKYLRNKISPKIEKSRRTSISISMESIKEYTFISDNITKLQEEKKKIIDIQTTELLRHSINTVECRLPRGPINTTVVVDRKRYTQEIIHDTVEAMQKYGYDVSATIGKSSSVIIVHN